MIVNELITKLTFRNDKAGAERHERSINKMAEAAERFFRRNNSLTSSYDRSFKRAVHGNERVWRDAHARMRADHAKFVSQSQGGIGRLSKMLGPVTKGVVGLTSAYLGLNAAKSAAQRILETGSTFESLEAGLVTAVGQKNASSEFERLAAFGAKFPSTIPKVVQSFTQLKNLGLNSSDRALISYGDIAASTVGKQVSDVTAMVADATTFQFERMREFGFTWDQRDDEVDFFFKKRKYTIKKNAEAIEKFIMDMGTQHFGGAMERQAKTIGGKMSNLEDAIQISIYRMWKAGLKYPIHSIITKLTDKVVEFIPKMAEFGKTVDKYAEIATVRYYQLADSIRSLEPLLKPLALGLGLVGLHMLGLKTSMAFSAGTGIFGSLFKAGAWIGSMFLKFKKFFVMAQLMFSLGGIGSIGSMLAAGASALVAALTPLLIGGAIAAAIGGVVWLGYQLYKYWTQGSSALDGMRERFPYLADSIQYLGDVTKEWWPQLKVAWLNIKRISIGMADDLMPVAKDLFKNVLIPLLGFTINRTADFFKGLKIIYDTAMPAIVTAFYYWQDVFRDVWGFIEPKIKWMYDKFVDLGALIKGVFGGGDDGNGGGATSVNPSRSLYKAAGGDFFTKNNSLAADMVRMGRGIMSGAKMCLKGVWMTHKAAAGTSKITARLAYQAADQLAADKSFKEIVVTPEMYQKAMAGDEEMRQLLHGVTVIYNRKSGFSSTAGHAEIWDMVRKKALFGLGPKALARDNQHLQNARFFLPVGQKPSTMPNISGGSGGGGGQGVQVPIQQNFYGPATPQQTRNAAQMGAQQGVHRANLSVPRRAPG